MPCQRWNFTSTSAAPTHTLSHLVIPEIEQRTGVRFELCPDPAGRRLQVDQQPLPGRKSRVGIKNKPEYERLETRRFIRRHGITRYQPNPFFPVNTLVLMRGAIAAQSLGVFERYVDEMYPAYVGRAQENGRSASVARGAGRVGTCRRTILRARPNRRRSRTSCSKIPGVRLSAAPSARRRSSSARRSSLARIGCATSRR